MNPLAFNLHRGWVHFIAYSALYLGYKTSQENSKRIANLINMELKLTHTQLYKMEKSQTDYTLIEKPYNIQ